MTAPKPPRGLDRSVWYAPSLGLAYLRNPKVACSSIQKSIWLAIDPDSFAGNPHARAVGPFNDNFREAIRDPQRFSTAVVFSVVRNPFSRVLSAYLDKTGATLDRAVWKGIADRLGFQRSDRPTLNEVLRRLVADNEPETMDHHLRPQAYNLLHDWVVPDFVGHFERFDAVNRFLAEHGCEVEEHAPHATGAGERVASRFDAEAIELVREYYRLDFELYGYGDQPLALAPERELAIPPGGKDRLISEIRRQFPRASA